MRGKAGAGVVVLATGAARGGRRQRQAQAHGGRWWLQALACACTGVAAWGPVAAPLAQHLHYRRGRRRHARTPRRAPPSSLLPWVLDVPWRGGIYEDRWKISLVESMEDEGAVGEREVTETIAKPPKRARLSRNKF